ncbi:hypothetical protein AB4097_02495 [Microvirga sp. 2MCAF35]|uniref:hypothetical protein n=1 Tax=Microvirga sp. 2MCAF35 TaxID=3232987 RepID=UPI003F964703
MVSSHGAIALDATFNADASLKAIASCPSLLRMAVLFFLQNKPVDEKSNLYRKVTSSGGSHRLKTAVI